MSKTPSEKLHRLVRLLTPAEKRYFRLFAQSKSERDSKYLHLFEALNKMETLDEVALKKKVYHTKAVEGKKFSELKAYLYELILKSLQAFDESLSVEYGLNRMLDSVGVLFRRGAYDDCRDLLRKAAKIAREYEYFHQGAEIVRWEKQLAYTQMDVDFLFKNSALLDEEEGRLLEQINNLAQYRKAFFSIYAIIKQDASGRKDERSASVKKLMAEPLFAGIASARSHRAQVYYLRTLNFCHYLLLDQEAFHLSGEQLIRLLESQPHFLKESLAEYIAALSNYIVSCGLLQKYEEVELCLQKLRRLKPITQDDRHKIHRQYYANYFALCQFTGAFEAARKEMPHCQAEAARFDPHAYETASFYYQYCYICFGCGDYAGALDYLNLWLNQPRSIAREDLQSMARILQLILHYEMGNTVLFESLLRSATRFMKKKERLYDLEKRFMHLAMDLVRAPSAKERRAAFVGMRADLETLKAQPEAKNVLQTFDLEAWLESKIDGQSFAAVVQARWAQRNKSGGAS